MRNARYFSHGFWLIRPLHPSACSLSPLLGPEWILGLTPGTLVLSLRRTCWCDHLWQFHRCWFPVLSKTQYRTPDILVLWLLALSFFLPHLLLCSLCLWCDFSICSLHFGQWWISARFHRTAESFFELLFFFIAWSNTWQKQLKGGRIYSASWFQKLLDHHGKKDIIAEAGGKTNSLSAADMKLRHTARNCSKW